MKALTISLSTFLLFFSTLGFAHQEFYEFDEYSPQSQTLDFLDTSENFEQAFVNPVQAIHAAIIKLNQLKKIANFAPQFVGELVDADIAPLFDFDHISDEILLANNVQLRENEQQFFTAKIKQNIVSALLSKITQNRSAAFQFISARPMMGDSIAVKLKIEGYYSYDVLLDLIFHQTDNQEWKIADVVLNNDSLVNYYQKMVSIKLRRYGVYGMLSRF